MLVTLFGISILVKPLQPLKALSPILVTLSGMIVLLNPNISSFSLALIIALQSFLLS